MAIERSIGCKGPVKFYVTGALPSLLPRFLQPCMRLNACS